jgi:hypothetical protein
MDRDNRRASKNRESTCTIATVRTSSMIHELDEPYLEVRMS